MQELAKEEQLLINCARVKMPPDLARQTEELCSANLNWSRILDLSDRHGITPLVYHSLRNLNVNGYIGSDNMSYLRGAYYANAVRNLKLYEQLKEILVAFNKAGIETIVLKGAALAETVYRNIALRTMDDIDLMVQKENLKRADDVMKELGYRNGSPRINSWYLRNHHHLPSYRRSPQCIPVEIHYHIIQPAYKSHITVEELFSRCVKEKIGGVQALVLSPSDLLLHVCMHAATVGAKNIRISQLCDVAELIRAKMIDWDQVIKRSVRWGIAKNVYTCLYLIRHLFQDADITLEVLKKFKINSSSLERWLTGDYKRDLFDPHYSIFDQIFWVDNWFDRAKLLFKKARTYVSRGLMLREIII